MDVCARGLMAAAAMLEDGGLEDMRAARYAGWSSDDAQAMLGEDLASIAARVMREGINPTAGIGSPGTSGELGQSLRLGP